MSSRRTTYSVSPGCAIVLLVLLVWAGLIIGIGIELASRML